MLSQVRLAVDSAREDQNFLHIDDAAWEKIQGQSLDYAILEKTDQIACVKFSSDWSDLGDWNALSEQLPDDGEGMSLQELSPRLIVRMPYYGLSHKALILLDLASKILSQL